MFKFSTIVLGIIIICLGGYCYYQSNQIDKLELTNTSLNEKIELIQKENTACLTKIQYLAEETNKLQTKIDQAQVTVGELKESNKQYVNTIRETTVSNNCQDSLNWLVNQTKEITKEYQSKNN